MKMKLWTGHLLTSAGPWNSFEASDDTVCPPLSIINRNTHKGG